MLSLVLVSLFVFLSSAPMLVLAQDAGINPIEKNIRTWEQTLKHSENTQLHLKTALQLAQAYRELGLLPKSQQHLQSALQLAIEHQQHDFHINILIQQTEIYLENAQLPQAIENIKQALIIAKNTLRYGWQMFLICNAMFNAYNNNLNTPTTVISKPSRYSIKKKNHVYCG